MTSICQVSAKGAAELMDTSEILEDQLQSALIHLRDPEYQPPELLCTMTGSDPRDGTIPLQCAIIRLIERLERPTGLAPSARANEVYDVIHHRYVLRLTQEETAERLDLSVRQLARLQREGIHALARILWEQQLISDSSPNEREGQVTREVAERPGHHAQARNWLSQAKRELASLHASAPDSVSEVGEVLGTALQLASPLMASHGVRTQLEFVQPELVAAVHPSALLQVLLAAFGRLAPHVSRGQITVFAGLEDASVRIAMTGTLTATDRPAEDDLVRDILAPEGVSVEARVERGHVFLWVRAPSIGSVTVLAAEDNLDMVHFYRRCTAGTRYRIVQATSGREALEAVEAIGPDIIVMDVMLPDLDGWRLLMQLRENPATRQIPVIICTVVREQELALSLGAALYLPKPVRPRQFIQALDQALSRAATAGTTSRDKSGAAC